MRGGWTGTIRDLAQSSIELHLTQVDFELDCAIGKSLSEELSQAKERKAVLPRHMTVRRRASRQ